MNLDGEVISANGNARMVSMVTTVITRVQRVKMAAIVIMSLVSAYVHQVT